MTKRLNVLPYKMASASANALANALGVAKVRISASCRYNAAPNKLVINWGNAGSVQHTRLDSASMLNSMAAVNVAGNKLLAFRKLQEAGVQIPEFTTEHGTARSWLSEGKVVERNILRGHSAEGIVLRPLDDSLDLTAGCPLFTKYMRKTQEYRVHVVNGIVTDVQRKARRTETPADEVNWQIRNHDNGFIYAREFNMNERRQAELREISIAAVSALELDFGAVDLMVHADTGFTVLEVNTACGLEGTTLTRYVDAFNALANEQQPTEWSLDQTTDETQETETMTTTTQAPIATPFVLAVGANVKLAPSVTIDRNNPTVGGVVVGERCSSEELKFLVKFSNDVLNTYRASDLVQNTDVESAPVQVGHRKTHGALLPETDRNGTELHVGDTVSFVRNDENDIYVEYFGLGESAVIAGWDVNGTVVLENTVTRAGRTFSLDSEMPFGIAWYRIVLGTSSIAGTIPDEHNQPLPPVRFVELGDAGGVTYDTAAEYPNDRILLTAQLEEVAPVIFKLDGMKYTVLSDDAEELLEDLISDLDVVADTSGSLHVDAVRYAVPSGVLTAVKQEITNVAVSAQGI